MRASAPTALPSGDSRLPRTSVIAGFGIVSSLGAAALPLLTYTVSLAAFGLAHVLAELRYVDERFGPRVGRTVRVQMLALLGFVVGGRCLTIVGRVEAAHWRPVELCLVAALALTALPRLRAARPAAAALTLAVSAALVAGAIWAPLPTLLALALAHNVTPVGFFAERLRGGERRRMFGWCAGLLAVGGLIATGWPMTWLDALHLWHPEFSLLPSAGKLGHHLGQYVPAAWHGADFAIPLFSAAVFLQCLHYGAVLHVLPRLGAGETRPAETVVAWPRRPWFLALLAFAGLLLFGGFVVSFADARTLYSLAAAVHAWIEIPILLVALAPADPAAPSCRVAT